MSTTETTVTMIPVDSITISELNPRKDLDDAALEELTRSVASLGVINPVTVREVIHGGGEGPSYVLIAGQRRLRAAEGAGLATIPAIVRTGDEDLDEGISVAENVIRADLTPLEEANAYKVLLDQHGGGVEHVASLVGRSVDTIRDRVRLLALPATTQQRIAERKITLACSHWLTVIAEQHPALCDAVAELLVDADEDAQRDFPDDPGSVVDAALGEGVLAWSAGGYSDPIAPTDEAHRRDVALLFEWLHPHAKLRTAWEALPAVDTSDSYNYKPTEELRRRARLLSLTEEDLLQASAYGCVIELPTTGYRAQRRYYITDPEWIDEHVGARVAAYEPGDTTPDVPKKRTVADQSEEEKAKRQADRDAAYAERVAARARNLDVGAAMQKYQPDLSLDEVKLLAAITLHHYGPEAAYAYRLCEEQPVKTSKAGKETVQYPRGQDVVKQGYEDAWAALSRAKTPKEAAGVALRLLVAHHLVDESGLPNADTIGMREASELSSTQTYDMQTGKSRPNPLGRMLDRLAAKLAPASVKKHKRERDAKRKDDDE